MIFQSMKMAWESVISNKLRTFLTMLGIIIGVLALVVLVSIVTGATSQVTDVISSMGTDKLQISIFDDGGKPLKIKDMDDIAALPGVRAAAPLSQDVVTVKAGKKSGSVQVTGTTAAYREIQGLSIVSGRWLRSTDQENHTAVTVINGTLAKDILGVSHTSEAVGMTMNLNGIPYTVVGVLGDSTQMMDLLSMSAYSAYVPYSTLVRSSRTGGAINSLVVSAGEETLAEAEASVRSYLSGRFGADEEDENERYYIFNMSQIMDSMGQVTAVMSIALGGIAAISLLVGGIGIMNIMLVSVTERTREIGIRKAIGAGNGSIMFQFLIEALMVSLIGCAVGVLASWGVLTLISLISKTSFPMDPGVVAVAVVFSLVIGLIFGIYPASKAASKKPIDALHFTN